MKDSTTKCPVCHEQDVYYNVVGQSYACLHCGFLSNKSRDSCPRCGSKKIGPDLAGFFWCHGACAAYQWLNR